MDGIGWMLWLGNKESENTAEYVYGVLFMAKENTLFELVISDIIQFPLFIIA